MTLTALLALAPTLTTSIEDDLKHPLPQSWLTNYNYQRGFDPGEWSFRHDGGRLVGNRGYVYLDSRNPSHIRAYKLAIFHFDPLFYPAELTLEHNIRSREENPRISPVFQFDIGDTAICELSDLKLPAEHHTLQRGGSASNYFVLTVDVAGSGITVEGTKHFFTNNFNANKTTIETMGRRATAFLIGGKAKVLDPIKVQDKTINARRFDSYRTTMMDLNELVEKLGATLTYQADQARLLIQGKSGNAELLLGTRSFKVNNQTFRAEAPVAIHQTHFYVPEDMAKALTEVL